MMTSGTEFTFKMNEAALKKTVKDTVRQLVQEIAEDILVESQKLVPVDTGALKRTGHVEGPYVFSNYVYEDVIYDAGYAAYVEYGRRSTGQVQEAAVRRMKESIYTPDAPWFRKTQSAYRKQLVDAGYSKEDIQSMMRQFTNTYGANIPALRIRMSMRQSFPPPGAIYQWLIRKGHSPEEARRLVYPVSKKIVEKGIKARHFLLKAVKKTKALMKIKYMKDFKKFLKIRMKRGGILQRGQV